MALFAVEWLSVDIVTLLMLAALVALGVLTPEEAFLGFANEVIVILASVFILSGALARAGVMGWPGALVHRLAGRSEGLLVGLLMTVAASVSAFFSNTSATALLMPTSYQLAKRAKLVPSRLLMPLAYGSILGGTCTVIGTSTNIAGSGFITRFGLEPFSLFEFSAVGVVIATAGVLYMAIVGHRLVPRRGSDSMTGDYQVRAFLSELMIEEGSQAIGKRLSELQLEGEDVLPLMLIRAKGHLAAARFRTLLAGDKIVVKASKEALLRLKDRRDFGIEADKTLGDKDLTIEGTGVSEAVVMPQSTLIDRTLKQLRFDDRFGAVVLAIYRRGQAYPAQIENMPLRVGDVLLLQGSQEAFERLRSNSELWGLYDIDSGVISKRKGFYVLSALVGAVALSFFGLLPLSIAFLLACLAVVLTRCISMEEAYRMVEWRLIVLIGGMTGFGVAMQKTGAAEYLSELIVAWTMPLGVTAVLVAFAALTVILTQPMSNAAAALVVLPIALNTAEALSINPRSMAVLVTLAASLSFITPLEPSSLLVYGPGKYNFRDFLICGLPLTLIVLVLLVVMVPILWPL